MLLAFWDPYHLYLIYNNVIEKIQRRATRWTLSDFNSYSSVSNMLTQLQWSSLEKQQSDLRLCMFYRILHDPDVPIQIPHYIILTQYPTRDNHPYHYILPHTSTTVLTISRVFLQTIKEWNNLPL